jgi:HSP20 family protein
MRVVSWDPSRDLDLLQGDVNRLFDRFFAPAGAPGAAAPGRFVPPIDVAEEEAHYLVLADLPGVAEEDITIEVEDRTLRIAGERKPIATEHEGQRRIERQWGTFERTLTLPPGVDPDAVQASFERGVLELRVPKPEERRPRRIRLSADSTSPQHELVEG